MRVRYGPQAQAPVGSASSGPTRTPTSLVRTPAPITSSASPLHSIIDSATPLLSGGLHGGHSRAAAVRALTSPSGMRSSSSSAPSTPSTSGRCLSQAPAGPWPSQLTSSSTSSTCFLHSRSRHAAHTRRPRLVAVAAAASGSSAGRVEPEGPRVEEPSTALLLAWFACRNRSLFAAQCLVEVVAELYREGRSFEELQLSLKLATQGGGLLRGSRNGPRTAGLEPEGEAEVLVTPPLLQGQEEDVLVSWVALIFLTLEELGVPRDRQQQQENRDGDPGRDQPQSVRPPPMAGFGESAVGGGGGGGGGMAAGSAYLRGMLGYVRQTLGMYDEGQTLARVAGLQGLVQQASGASSSPFLVLMQQYTRLVLLAVEVVAAARLPTARPLRPPETVARPSGYAGAFTGACNAVLLDGGGGDNEDGPRVAAAVRSSGSGDQAAEAGGGAAGGGGSGGVETCPARGLAVRLLMAFMGAVLGSPWSLGKFVEAVRVAYDQGLAADELFSQLDEQEFVQSGGILPVAGPATAAAAADRPAAPPSEEDAGGAGALTPAAAGAAEALTPPPPPPAPQHQITKALLSTWISLSYMTLAQLGVPYPAAGERLGWAWAGFGDPIEAIGMNDFVGNVLRQMAGADPRAVPPPPPPPPPPLPTELLQAAEPLSSEAAAAGPSAAEVGAEAEVGAGPQAPQRRRGDAPLVRVEDDSLSATSTAFQVLSQQVALVQAVCRDVVTESQG